MPNSGGSIDFERQPVDTFGVLRNRPNNAGCWCFYAEIKSKEDLLPPGANPGTVPTDLDHATGLERLELLGKIEGVEIFDWTPLDASRTGEFTAEGMDCWKLLTFYAGTMENPIVVKAPSEEQWVFGIYGKDIGCWPGARYLGCTGSPADSHETVWVTVSRTRPYERCTECGSVYKLEYTGPPVDENAQPCMALSPAWKRTDMLKLCLDAHEDIKTFADYVKPEYTARYPAGWTGSAQ